MAREWFTFAFVHAGLVDLSGASAAAKALQGRFCRQDTPAELAQDSCLTV